MLAARSVPHLSPHRAQNQPARRALGVRPPRGGSFWGWILPRRKPWVVQTTRLRQRDRRCCRAGCLIVWFHLGKAGRGCEWPAGTTGTEKGALGASGSSRRDTFKKSCASSFPAWLVPTSLSLRQPLNCTTKQPLLLLLLALERRCPRPGGTLHWVSPGRALGTCRVRHGRHCSSRRGDSGYPAALPAPFGIAPLSPADLDQGLADHGGKNPRWDVWHGSATPCAVHQAFGFPLLSSFGPISKKTM